jgi:hypothetical protein
LKEGGLPVRQVPVFIAWLVNAFENSSQYSEYYLDLRTGDVKFFCPMDFPEHSDRIKRLDRSENYMKLPKLEKELARRIKKEFIDLTDDPGLKELLEKALAADVNFRRALMGLEDESARLKWYQYQNKRYGDYLRDWFKEKGVELVEKPPVNVLEFNKGC